MTLKKLLFTLTIVVSICSYGQAPEGFKYQAVVRGNDGAPMSNEAVGIKITLRQGTANGTSVYAETFTPTTNDHGLVNIQIGSGTSSDDFSTIDWENGPFFIETAVDLSGGTNYDVMGASQLLSVPYALHAKTAESVIADLVDDADNDPTNEIQTISRIGTTVTLSNGGGSYADSVGVYTAGSGIEITDNVISVSESETEHYVGEFFGGGIVIHVDHTGQHGLIMSLEDLSTSAQAGTFSSNSPWDGASNTSDALAGSAAGSGVVLCSDYDAGGFTDWYLPSRDEMRIIVNNLYEVNKALDSDGDPLTTIIFEGLYHTSSHKASSGHYYYNFTLNSGYHYNNGGSESANGYIRAVRAF
ncbi:hypothetical protein [Ekhidna sp.]|uniref:hypothetical protein n=1 Tax=Ekhidna sp. TaxID=2608089 RepID=UPI00351442D3